jgi:DNA-binding transcriptional LysR family regulator
VRLSRWLYPAMIELRQLRQFVALAEELNFGRAATRLHMSQPPLSVAIRKLESELGLKLVDRSRHHVRLTTAGAVFLKDARLLLLQAHAAVERARGAARGATGSLSLSFVPSAALDLLPAIFKSFQQLHPTVQLTVTAATTTRQIEALRQAEVDLALVVSPLQDASDLALTNLQRQGFVLAVPRGHALAALASVRVKALAAESFIAFSAAEGAGFAAALQNACKAAGFVPRVVQEASQMQAVLTLVAGGLGIAMVPAAMRRLVMKEVAYLELAGGRSPPGYQLAFAHLRSNDNPAIQAFLAAAAKVLRTAGSG